MNINQHANNIQRKQYIAVSIIEPLTFLKNKYDSLLKQFLEPNAKYGFHEQNKHVPLKKGEYDEDLLVSFQNKSIVNLWRCYFVSFWTPNPETPRFELLTKFLRDNESVNYSLCAPVPERRVIKFSILQDQKVKSLRSGVLNQNYSHYYSAHL